MTFWVHVHENEVASLDDAALLVVCAEVVGPCDTTNEADPFAMLRLDFTVCIFLTILRILMQRRPCVPENVL